MTDDFFRNRLDQMIDLLHPLAGGAGQPHALAGDKNFLCAVLGTQGLGGQ